MNCVVIFYVITIIWLFCVAVLLVFTSRSAALIRHHLPGNLKKKMGVLGLYRWLVDRYPNTLCTVLEERSGSGQAIDSSRPNPNGVEFDNLYIDMNGLIHPCFHPEGLPAPESYDDVLKSMFRYIDRIFSIVRPRKLLFLAVDGVAPRAKMNHQRIRRFRSAREGSAKGIGNKKLDSNVITPGTEFMDSLCCALQYYVHLKMNSDPAWRKIKVVLSDSTVAGEGEHKIFSFIRSQRNLPGYDPNTRHCLHGLDADLIILALATHEIHMSILREVIFYGKPKSSKSAAKYPESIQIHIDRLKFELFNIWVLREYLERDLLSNPNLEGTDFERLIDDFVFMCLFVGNDFLPRLPSLDVDEAGIELLLIVYQQEFPTIGYLTDSSKVNLKSMEQFLQALSSHEGAIFMKRTQVLNEKSTRKRKRSGFQDSVSGRVHGRGIYRKTIYYTRNFDCYRHDIDRIKRDAVFKYTEGVCWIMDYYYQGVCSWQWFYPYHYAPFASDFCGLDKLEINFKLGQPLKPFDQLLGVLPAASAQALPLFYRELMTKESSPILDFYPEDFKSDRNGKKHAWQGVCKLPFIDESRLLSETVKVEHTLTAEEKQRNMFGRDRLLVHSSHPLGDVIKDDDRSSELEIQISPGCSGGMNGYLCISAKPVCPSQIPSPVDDEHIRGNQVKSVDFKCPSEAAHVSKLLSGVIMPPKILGSGDIPPPPVVWHESLTEESQKKKRKGDNTTKPSSFTSIGHEETLQVEKKWLRSEKRDEVSSSARRNVEAGTNSKLLKSRGGSSLFHEILALVEDQKVSVEAVINRMGGKKRKTRAEKIKEQEMLASELGSVGETDNGEENTRNKTESHEILALVEDQKVNFEHGKGVDGKSNALEVGEKTKEQEMVASELGPVKSERVESDVALENGENTRKQKKRKSKKKKQEIVEMVASELGSVQAAASERVESDVALENGENAPKRKKRKSKKKKQEIVDMVASERVESDVALENGENAPKRKKRKSKKKKQEIVDMVASELRSVDETDNGEENARNKTESLEILALVEDQKVHFEDVKGVDGKSNGFQVGEKTKKQKRKKKKKVQEIEDMVASELGSVDETDNGEENPRNKTDSHEILALVEDQKEQETVTSELGSVEAAASERVQSDVALENGENTRKRKKRKSKKHQLIDSMHVEDVKGVDGKSNSFEVGVKTKEQETVTSELGSVEAAASERVQSDVALENGENAPKRKKPKSKKKTQEIVDMVASELRSVDETDNGEENPRNKTDSHEILALVEDQKVHFEDVKGVDGKSNGFQVVEKTKEQETVTSELGSVEAAASERVQSDVALENGENASKRKKPKSKKKTQEIVDMVASELRSVDETDNGEENPRNKTDSHEILALVEDQKVHFEDVKGVDGKSNGFQVVEKTKEQETVTSELGSVEAAASERVQSDVALENGENAPKRKKPKSKKKTQEIVDMVASELRSVDETDNGEENTRNKTDSHEILALVEDQKVHFEDVKGVDGKSNGFQVVEKTKEQETVTSELGSVEAAASERVQSDVALENGENAPKRKKPKSKKKTQEIVDMVASELRSVDETDNGEENTRNKTDSHEILALVEDQKLHFEDVKGVDGKSNGFQVVEKTKEQETVTSELGSVEAAASERVQSDVALENGENTLKRKKRKSKKKHQLKDSIAC
ncbi:hypothetical protein L1887_08476 [Cichorium endivia]|nr:hypothetical protein L1887_08476 [Cichorium endivia]